jgi:hypothetical protein
MKNKFVSSLPFLFKMETSSPTFIYFETPPRVDTRHFLKPEDQSKKSKNKMRSYKKILTFSKENPAV